MHGSLNPVAPLRARLNGYRYDPDYRDDAAGLHCCRLALAALEQGNYGVGAIALSAEGQILMQDQNRVFENGYRPHRHAEMNLLDRLEARFGDRLDRGGLTLMVSLEPCPMCLCRLLACGIGRLRYLVPDPDGGLVRRLDRLPPAWADLARLQQQGEADISPALRALAADLAQANRAALRQRVMGHIRPRLPAGQG